MTKKVLSLNKWLLILKQHPVYKAWKMKELSLEDKKIYDTYIKETEYEASTWSSNFTYLWAHTNSKKLIIFKAFIDNCLVTLILTNKGRLYMPCLPYGKGNSNKICYVILKCSHFCFKWNQISGYTHKSSVNPINEVQLAFLKSSIIFHQYFKEEQLSGLERHYSIHKLIDLHGKEFSKVRNKLNNFNKIYKNAIVRKYKITDLHEVLKVGNVWEASSGQKYKRILDGFYFEPIIKNYQALNHLILVIVLDEKIIGITTGEILPTGQAWGCITKFDNEYKGLSEKLTIEFIKLIHEMNPNIQYINVGSDLGHKGLAFFKERFRPVLNYKRYAIFYKGKH